MNKYFKLFRIKHYVKNVLVFVPLFFSGKMLEVDRLRDVFAGVLCFCMVSSAVYMINDIRDAEKDRIHPVKKNRPIASGAVTKKQASVLAAVLALLAISISGFCFGTAAIVLITSYLFLNIAYSFGLKNMALLDVCILVSGFLIRILYGGAVAGIKVSNWMYLTVISASFCFALGKRKNELKRNGEITRNVLSFYTKEFLDKNMYMCMGLTNGFYALWSMEQADGLMVCTVPIVLVLTMRYSLIIEGGLEEDPVDILLKDKMILILGAVYAVTILMALYMGWK